MSLRDYRSKRRFDRTREPAPEAAAGGEGRSIFVVQLHHARRRHYDVRLQVGDALKSWAVPKGPSFDPDVKRLAVEVEDHPVGYASFEGDIPEGEYGAGHVDLYDRGYWSTPDDAERQIVKGHLRFELFGERLKGAWHLVRSGGGRDKPQWFLIKVKDRYAGKIEADDLLDATPAGKTKSKAKKATAKKTRRAGAKHRASAGLAAAAAALQGSRKALLKPEFFEPQLATSKPRVPGGEGWLHEVKWDGYRIVSTIVDGRPRAWSRNAIEWTAKIPDIVQALADLGLRSARLDGELIAVVDGHSDFGALQETLSGERQAPLAYALFDLPHLEGCDLTRCTLVERKALLERVVALADAGGHLLYSSHHRGDGDAVFEAASAQGLEGIVSKRVDSPYRSGRGDDWLKIKRLESGEYAVIGYTLPRGSRHGFGSLLLGEPSGKGWRYAGRVGAGFSDQLLRELSGRLAGGRRKPVVPVSDIDPTLRGALWLAPEIVAEVFHRGLGNQGVLRQPSLKAVRLDKGINDLERPAAPAEPVAAAREVKITHPARIVYERPKTTKQGVVDYYADVMDALLPELAGRPLSVVRCPDGVDKPCFFQKHFIAGLKHVGTVRLKEISGAGANYLYVEDAASVLELVQFGTIEFHPWGSTVENPERANRIVFDLDPGEDVGWDRVVAAARLLRRLLDSVELASFLRVSGGKGLHVVVPLNPGCDWSLVKSFAQGFAETLAAMHPLEFVATASKRFRKGRIFVDYLRNARGATSVASYSLRARPGAYVAMPIAWSELGRVGSSQAFDIASARQRLARRRTDPWQGIDALRQDLDKVGELLSGAGGRPRG